MTLETSDTAPAALTDSASLLARGTAAAWADEACAPMKHDLWLPDHARLDDRMRAALVEQVRRLVGAIAEDVAARANAALAHVDGSVRSIPTDPGMTVFERLQRAGLLDDDALIADVCAHVRGDLLGEALAANRQPGSAPLLVPRLIACDDPQIAAAATAYLLAEGTRGALHGVRDDVRRRLTWQSAAALRASADGAPVPPGVDRALMDAARASLADGERGDKLSRSALRLAAAIAPRAAELPDLLVEALEEGRVALFAALLAQARGIALATARALVLDVSGTALWLALRAQDIDRSAIARIGLALAHADPRRDLEAFVEDLDTIAAITPDAAGSSLAPLGLDHEFRAAVRAIQRAAA